MMRFFCQNRHVVLQRTSDDIICHISHIIFHFSNNMYHVSFIIKGSLEVKLPTPWRDEKRRREEQKRESLGPVLEG